jgi:hypothetical protein
MEFRSRPGQRLRRQKFKGQDMNVMRHRITRRSAPGDSISLRFCLLWLPKSACSRCSYASNRFISSPLRTRIQSPVSNIPSLKFHLELVHARQGRSLADSPQYNGPVKFDLVVSRFVSLLIFVMVHDSLEGDEMV